MLIGIGSVCFHQDSVPLAVSRCWEVVWVVFHSNTRLLCLLSASLAAATALRLIHLEVPASTSTAIATRSLLIRLFVALSPSVSTPVHLSTHVVGVRLVASVAVFAIVEVFASSTTSTVASIPASTSVTAPEVPAVAALSVISTSASTSPTVASWPQLCHTSESATATATPLDVLNILLVIGVVIDLEAFFGMVTAESDIVSDVFDSFLDIFVQPIEFFLRLFVLFSFSEGVVVKELGPLLSLFHLAFDSKSISQFSDPLLTFR